MSSPDFSINKDEKTPLVYVASEEAPAADIKGASAIGSYVNLVNTIIGAGLLAIPFAFRSAGVVLGVVFLSSVCLLSSLSFDLLAQSAHFTGLFTYKQIAEKSWGKPLAWVGEVSIFVYTVFNTIARPIIISDFLRSVLCRFVGGHSVVTQKWFLILCLQLVLLPFCLLRQIDFLKISSFFSLLCVLFASVVVAVRFGTTPKPLSVVMLWPDGVGMFVSFGILVLSFCAHYNMPRMYQELQGRTPAKMRGVIYASTLTCFVVYLCVGILGYLTFLSDTDGNILNDYHDDDNLVTAARVALCAALILSTPLVLFASRRSAMTMFFPNKGFSWIRWTLLTIVLLAFVGVIGYVVPNIQLIFGFSGSLLGSLFVFILPALFFYRTVPNPSRKHLCMAALLVVAGTLLLTLGATGATFKLVAELNATANATHHGNCTV